MAFAWAVGTGDGRKGRSTVKSFTALISPFNFAYIL